jgi:hypothetical protein
MQAFLAIISVVFVATWAKDNMSRYGAGSWSQAPSIDFMP